MVPSAPPWTYEVTVPEETSGRPDLTALPQAPGLFAFESADGQTVGLATTRNLRRLVASRLTAPDPDERSRRTDYRSVTRRVLATRVGSSFEADWAFLQAARDRLPLVYAGLCDRYRAWFARCDPAARFPRWTRTDRPSAERGTRVLVGPMATREAAGTYVQMLEEAFDLCRYHDVLVQAPHGTACAYKEMGRCPAPCDGSVSMSAYGEQVTASVDFARSPLVRGREGIEHAMTEASQRLEFEQAESYRRQLDRLKPAGSRDLKWVDDMKSFRFVSVQPNGRPAGFRLFVIRGAVIVPVVDVVTENLAQQVDDAWPALECELRRGENAATHSVDNIGLVSWYLYHPRQQPDSAFLRADEDLRPEVVTKTIEALGATPAVDEPDVKELFADEAG